MVNVLGLHPAWSCDAINEIKSSTGLAMGSLDEIQHYSTQATAENTLPDQSSQLAGRAGEADVSKGRYAASSELTAARPPPTPPNALLITQSQAVHFKSTLVHYDASVDAREPRRATTRTLTT